MKTYENFDSSGFIDMISVYRYIFTVISIEISLTTVSYKNIIFVIRLRSNLSNNLCTTTAVYMYNTKKKWWDLSVTELFHGGNYYL